jgi:hypothetical protein
MAFSLLGRVISYVSGWTGAILAIRGVASLAMTQVLAALASPFQPFLTSSSSKP